MLSNSSLSKTKLRYNNKKKNNVVASSKNIFQLIEDIPKKLSYQKIRSINLYSIAENLIAFLNKFYPKELNDLEFNPNRDNIHTLIGSLFELINNKNYTIVYDDENRENETIQILYDIPCNQFMWYVFDIKTIDLFPCEELQIGFAYFLKNISTSCSHNALKSDYTDLIDNPYEMEFEMMIDDDRALDENYEYDEGISQSNNEEALRILNELQQLKIKYDLLVRQSIEIFQYYIPKSQKEQSLKEILLEGLNIDFSIKDKFHPDSDIYNDGGVHFSENYLIFCDSDSIDVEIEHFNYISEQSNNGVSYPCGWYSISNGIVEHQTSPADILYYKYSQEFIIRFYQEYLNLMSDGVY